MKSNDRNMAHTAYVNFLKYEEKQSKLKQLKDSERSAASSSASTGLLSPRNRNKAMGGGGDKKEARQPMDSVMELVEMIRNRKG